jgi:hypothetical protein
MLIFLSVHLALSMAVDNLRERDIFREHLG